MFYVGIIAGFLELLRVIDCAGNAVILFRANI